MKDNMVQYQISDIDTVAGKVKYGNKIEIKMNKLNLISNYFLMNFLIRTRVKVIADTTL